MGEKIQCGQGINGEISCGNVSPLVKAHFWRPAHIMVPATFMLTVLSDLCSMSGVWLDTEESQNFCR